MKTLKDFYIFCSASISSCSYIFHTPFNHISANFEKKMALTLPPPLSEQRKPASSTGYRVQKKNLIKNNPSS